MENQTHPRVASSEEGLGFSDFLRAEYEHIADAHFKTIDTISTFFQQYLLILSVPISVIIVLLRLNATQDAFVEAIKSAPRFFAFLLGGIALIGLMVLWYIVNLRMDAVLYARTINGIRKFFYDQAPMAPGTRLSFRVLPQSPQLPPFRERYHLWPVVIAFALLDSIYILVAATALTLVNPTTTGANASVGAQTWSPALLPCLVSAFFFALHIGGYCWETGRNERGNLRSTILGTDIDGVLNRHRECFCEVLRSTSNKIVRPEQLTALPVRDIPNLAITKADEIAVFNTPEYWVDMPAMAGAAEVIRDLRNAYNMKVFVFTHRPWPLASDEEKSGAAARWNAAIRAYRRRLNPEPGLRMRLGWWLRAAEPPGLARGLSGRLQIGRIEHITRLWLAQHGFEFDNLLVEGGSENVADPHSRIHNRFSVARAKQVRFFVEDDPNKARKMAFICDIVFLMDQPYNANVAEMPSNVIRVCSWAEIRSYVKTVA